MGFGKHLRPKVAGVFVFVFGVLIPKLALADAGEDVVRSIGNAVWMKLRGSILPYVYAVGKDVDFGVWGWIFSILATGLTLVWLWRWKPFQKDVGDLVGKTAGPFALIGWVVMIGISLAYMAIGLVQGLLTGAIMTALTSIPILGTILGLFPSVQSAISALVGMIVGLVFVIGIAVYIAKNVGSLVQEAFGAFKSIITGAGDKPSMKYKIAGTIAISALINRPEWYAADWSFPLYGWISILSAVLGLYVLVTTTGKGRDLVAGAKKADIRETDGYWKCPVKARAWVLDKKGNRKMDAEHPGEFLSEVIPCKGADGSGYNHPDSPQCGNPACAQLNSDYIKCPHCGHPKKVVDKKKEDGEADGEKKTWVRRQQRWQYHTCESCGYNIPPPVKEESFYEPKHVHPYGPSVEGLLATGQKERAEKLRAQLAAEAGATTKAAPTAEAPAQVGEAAPAQVGEAAPAQPAAAGSPSSLLAGNAQWDLSQCPTCHKQFPDSYGARVCPYCTGSLDLELDLTSPPPGSRVRVPHMAATTEAPTPPPPPKEEVALRPAGGMNLQDFLKRY